MHKKILIPLMLLSAVFLAGCATQSPKCKTCSRKSPVGSVQTVRTTAYTQTEPGGWHSAIGTRLCDKNGTVKSAAADWSRFPLGTKFKILSTGEVYEVCDYGSALVGKDTIDLFKSSRRAMHQWGARCVQIEILRWGSPEKSREWLSPRSRHPHIQSMLASLSQES